jgi:hypothetical protein
MNRIGNIVTQVYFAQKSTGRIEQKPVPSIGVIPSGAVLQAEGGISVLSANCRKTDAGSRPPDSEPTFRFTRTKRMILPPLTHPPKETTMKKLYGLVVLVLLLAPALFAQEHYTEGPIWRVSLIRVKPTQMDAYLTSLRQSSKPFFDEEKKQGLIMDYKVFLKETKNNPEDWDICIAVEYKNHAAMDGLAAKTEAVRDKILGGKAPAQQLSEKRAEIRETVSSDLLQEIYLK